MFETALPNDQVENRLLAALSRDEYERILPQLQPVSFALGEVVYEFGGQLDYVYFPTTSIVSLLYTMENGTSAESRWLLLSHDRVKADELVMTQELIADMLGVRREGVTVAAGRLQDAGAISYVRGHIQILDRQRLEASVCECYRVVKDEFDRLLG